MEDYLDRELQRLDILIHREIVRLRARYQLSLDEFRGLYVSDRQVDALVHQPASGSVCVDELTHRSEELRKANIGSRPAAWIALEKEFKLSHFEQDVLTLALAREINLKYETLYAYLHNDVARKKPTVELALRVCSPGNRNAFLPESPLFVQGLLTMSADPADGLLGRELLVPLPVVRHLTGLDPESSIPVRTGVSDKLVSESPRLPRLLLIESRDTEAARAAIEAACHAANRKLLTIDLGTADLGGQAKRIRLLQRLENCGICLLNVPELLAVDQRAAEARHFFEAISSPLAPIWIIIPPATNWRGTIPSHAVRAIRMAEPSHEERRETWTRELPETSVTDIAALAARYSLNSSQIRSSAAYALDMLVLHGTSRAPDLNDVAEAVRAQSESTIGRFARKLAGHQDWDDLVLPASTLRQIRDVAAAMRHRHVVYAQWGFSRKYSGIEGIKVLFAGGSGTGKTMTAAVIGNDLGLEVFRVDLSGVVSKYIGETEKNLDRVFHAAQGSQSILFFDEADALFGKRSEVKDAHDRYANIEIAYLLQKFEEHDGPVILATNLRRNIDDAFSRRLHYVIEFPPPDETHRLLLWRKVFPEQTPVGNDVDFQFLATQFQLTGGDIRNVALDAAFLAAQNGVVTMREVTAAMSRQLLKQGKAPGIAEFKQYHGLLS